MSTSKPPHIAIRFVHARPILSGCAALAVAIVAGLMWLTDWRLSKDIVIAWNIAAVIYLSLSWRMMLKANEASMHKRAEQQDVAQVAILMLSVLTIIICITAVVTELIEAKTLHGAQRSLTIALVVATIVTSWAFVHTIFALHYAHAYYIGLERNKSPGLSFPDKDPTPDYLDFLYFSFIIGTAAQTADVAITSKAMRRTNLFHAVFAFFFNTAILALTINIAAGFVT
ncbi:DUF1345 domain-containing protein [Asticcacaulis endophyticus]|uniref:DUF1345 domain-containing protein n=1 Tax=Asticcacaulis endophyticus TaxID=1395890 RepID=A0A918QES6_9CAUL|nr:DUF1345 domain-containing protein [Asticcacaulis endophyticus]GGZ43296.1 hypothetical protein GCM10011273_32630 [Asticcacaulis endophyticus]